MAEALFVDECLAEIKKAQVEDERISRILGSPDETATYIAQAIWRHHVTREIIRLIRNREPATIYFQPFALMQTIAFRQNRVIAFAIQELKFPTEEVTQKLVARAIAEGLGATTYKRGCKSGCGTMLYVQTYVNIFVHGCEHTETTTATTLPLSSASLPSS
jgi:hypothetical protein